MVVALDETVGFEGERRPVTWTRVVVPPASVDWATVDMHDRVVLYYGRGALTGSTTEVQVREVGEWETVRPELEQEQLFKEDL